MKKYKVTITETLQMEVEVDAPNRSEANDLSIDNGLREIISLMLTILRMWILRLFLFKGSAIMNAEGLCGQLQKHRKKIMIRMSVG